MHPVTRGDERDDRKERKGTNRPKMVDNCGMREPAIRVLEARSQSSSDGAQVREPADFAMAILSIVVRPLLPLRVRCFGTSTARCARNIRRRVTRVPSDYGVYAEELNEDVKGANDQHQMQLVNRNPRNLEQLSLEPKPFGFELETTSKCYWNKWVAWFLFHSLMSDPNIIFFCV